MTENTKELIVAIAQNDLVRAKKAAIAVVATNKTKKDDVFCKQIISKLQNEPTIIPLPIDISNFAIMEDVSQTFIRNRYFLPDKEHQLYIQINNADKVNKILAEKRIRYINTTLLYGESGTGKTTFGRYVAYELGIPFLYLNFAYLIDSHLGQTGKNIQKVFEFAKKQRCVLMLDELDAIAISRGENNDVGEIPRIVIALMQSFDCLNNDIIVIAATNRLEAIDKAVTRRFSRVHEVKQLDTNESSDFASLYLSDCGYDISPSEVDEIIGNSRKQSEIEDKLINYIINKEVQEAKTDK